MKLTTAEILEASAIAHQTTMVTDAALDLALAASKEHAAEECERLVGVLRRLDARVMALWTTFGFEAYRERTDSIRAMNKAAKGRPPEDIDDDPGHAHVYDRGGKCVVCQ